MAADDKEGDERCQSRSLERDRGKRFERHHSASPPPSKQRHKHSHSLGTKEKHRHKDSIEKHEDRKGNELSNRNTEFMSKEDNDREVARKSGMEDDEKAGSRKSSKEDRKVQLHSSGDSSKNAYSDNESDRGRKKSRSKHLKSRKSKSKHHRHVRSESEQDESQTEGTSGESSEDSEDEDRRAKRRKRLKQKEKAERERKEEQRRKKKRKMKGKEQEQEKRKKRKEVEKQAEGPITNDVGDGSEGENMHGKSSNNDPILDPKHKIFLSHRGAQKAFVDHLCKSLEDRCHYPFFDRRHESLPKGERFPKLIVQAAEQCEMLIVVVSNEYFMSKWPMIELSAFVKAHKLHHGSNNLPKIFPLFFGLSVSDLGDEVMQKKWFQEWKALAKVDPMNQIVVSDWKNALDVLRSFNGLSYDMHSKEEVVFIERTVSNVCKSIVADIKWDDSHVQGKSSICKVIGEKIERVGVSPKYKVKVVGIHGVGGVGKTTICKTMCNELSNKYEGWVCHIEFPSIPWSDSKELLQKVLRDLTRKSLEVIQQLDEGECKDVLRKCLSKQRTFLVIDNISDNHQSIQEAKTFLEVPYHMESLVVVTTRSPSIFMLLGLDGDAYLEMPNLGEVDAINLFLNYAIVGKQFLEDMEKHDIMTCVRRCYFSKGDGRGHHYHPLALKSLGLQLGFHGENPCDWMKNLPRVRTFNFFPSGNPVFDILRSSFDSLPSRDQALFMDVGLFSKTIVGVKYPYLVDKTKAIIEWLCFAHKEDEEEIALQLEHLKRNGLLEDIDLRSKEISVHALYLEFVELEAKGSLNESINFREQMWVYIEDGDLTKLESKPEGGCWPMLKQLTIIQSPPWLKKNGRILDWIGSMEGMKWEYFSNLEVLQLRGCGGCGTLNLEGLFCLRILELDQLCEMDRIEGLEKLKYLTYFRFEAPQDYLESKDDDRGVHIVGQLPFSLVQLHICGHQVVLGLDPFFQCHNLSKLHLDGIEAHSLDLSKCGCLESVLIQFCSNLQIVLGLEPYPPYNLQSLKFYSYGRLVDIIGIDSFYGLKELNIDHWGEWKVPSLFALTKSQVNVEGQKRLLVFAKDCFFHQLQKLQWCFNLSNTRLNLTGFNQLEDLDLSWSMALTSLVELGDLPSLQCLDLSFCFRLQKLPNLNSSRNLQKLDLYGCSPLKLYKKDIHMLAKLPLLKPVSFGGWIESGDVKLDLARQKVIDWAYQ